MHTAGRDAYTLQAVCSRMTGGGGGQTAYHKCIINTASIGQRFDEGSVGVLISLYATTTE